MRAIALISMVSLHVKDGDSWTVSARILHSATWVDGAFLFVGLSGVVTGLVHRRIVARQGVAASSAKMARRAGFLYLVHLLLAAVIITARSTDPRAVIPYTPTWSGGSLVRVLLLQVQPDYPAVLPMYTFFLLWGVVAVRLLVRGRAPVVIALSTTVYLVAHFSGVSVFSPAGFQVLAWQLLFTGGLLVGWTWEVERLRLSPRFRRTTLWLSAGVCAVLYMTARVARGPVERLPGRLVDKNSGGPIAFVFAAAAMVVLYAVISRARRLGWARRALVVVAVLGSKGLPGYVAMVVCLLVLELVPAIHRDDGVVLVVVVICGVVEYLALRFDGRHRAVDAPAPTVPVPVS